VTCACLHQGRETVVRYAAVVSPRCGIFRHSSQERDLWLRQRSSRSGRRQSQQRSTRRERPEREHRLFTLPFPPNPDEAGSGEIFLHSVAVGRGEGRHTQALCNLLNKIARKLPASHFLCNHDITEFWRCLETDDRDASGCKLFGPIPLVGHLKRGDTNNAVSRWFAQKHERLRPVQSGADFLDIADDCSTLADDRLPRTRGDRPVVRQRWRK
jgi:hypothetical protein